MFSVALYAAALPAFLAGLLEDLTKRVGAGPRLLATLAAGAVFVLISGYAITKVDLPGVDWLLAFPAFAFVFTAFAIGGVANAMNIIDGVNGLAAGTAVIVLAGFAIIAGAVGDQTILAVSVVVHSWGSWRSTFRAGACFWATPVPTARDLYWPHWPWRCHSEMPKSRP